MKLYHQTGFQPIFLASPPGNGGRGLKLLGLVEAEVMVGASPPGNGGRGLKQNPKRIFSFNGVHRLPATGGVD